MGPKGFIRVFCWGEFRLGLDGTEGFFLLGKSDFTPPSLQGSVSSAGRARDVPRSPFSPSSQILHGIWLR